MVSSGLARYGLVRNGEVGSGLLKQGGDRLGELRSVVYLGLLGIGRLRTG